MSERIKNLIVYGVFFLFLCLSTGFWIGFKVLTNKDSFFRLERPLYLLFFLIPLFLASLRLFFRKRLTFQFPTTSKMRGLLSWWDRVKFMLPQLFLYAVFFFLFFSLSGPQIGNQEVEIETEGIDIILAIDASGSMNALDFALGLKTVNRLTVVKKVVHKFIRNRISDRIGMVVFGEMAFTQSPLTLDYDVLNQLLSRVEVYIAGEGTAIGDGLALSVKRLKESDAKSKVIILLTDGENTAGNIPPMKAAELAKAFGIKVYTVGVGSNDIVPIILPDGSRRRVQVYLDEKTLKGIADTTGGTYFHASDTKTLDAIYQKIDEMEKTKSKVRSFARYQHLFPQFVKLSLVLLFFYFLSLSTFVLRYDP